MVDSDDYVVAQALEKHIDGLVEQHRVLAHIGDKRSQALHSEGRHSEVLELSTEAGDVQSQIASYVREVREAHARGPHCFAWFVLRRESKAGNVAVSHAVPIGGESQREVEASVSERALAKAVDMGPMVLQAVMKAFNNVMAEYRLLSAHYLEARVAIADMNARAEAGDETAKWEAVAESVRELGPMARQAISAWLSSRGVDTGPDPAAMSKEDFVAVFNGLPNDVKAAFIQELREALAQEAAQQQASAPPPTGAA